MALVWGSQTILPSSLETGRTAPFPALCCDLSPPPPKEISLYWYQVSPTFCTGTRSIHRWLGINPRNRAGHRCTPIPCWVFLSPFRVPNSYVLSNSSSFFSSNKINPPGLVKSRKHMECGKGSIGNEWIEQEGSVYPPTASISAQPQTPCYVKEEK